MSTTTFEMVDLSGIPNNHSIQVTAATSGAAQVIHTATSDSAQKDELYLWAINVAGTGSEERLVVQTNDTSTLAPLSWADIPPNSGPHLVLDGARVSGGLTVEVYGNGSGSVYVYGNVNRGTSE